MRLCDAMEFDHVIRIRKDGGATMIEDEPGVYAPEAHYMGDGGDDRDLWVTAGWELLDGYSGQHGYSGPVMHSSEFIGGRMELDMLAEPGVYVAVVVTCDDEDDDVVGWAVARKVEAH